MIKYIYIGVFLVLNLVQIEVYSQQDLANTKKSWLYTSGIWFSKTFNNFDTVFVKNTPSKYSLILRNSNWLNFYNFDMDNKNKIVMQSELYYNAGFILGYKFLLLGYSVNLNETFSGQTVKSQELDLHVNCSCLGIDVYYTDNQGATSITEFKGIKNIKNKGVSFDLMA
ncbi:MAG TPA: DUF4421 family protein [Bacteroidales bacterium]|nr:DUF4421 family protein [Bacteroidales bacterium]